jgi:flagella basal body P-ring formation protein FlgA
MAIPIRVGQGRQSKPVSNVSRKTQDPRLWIGILFIVGAMVVGQLVVSGASARVPAVTLKSNIAEGALIRESDVTPVQVFVPDIENLIRVPSEVIGKVASRDLFAGELINVQSISNGFSADTRSVSLPIRAGHLPQIFPGEKVDIWMTPSL